MRNTIAVKDIMITDMKKCADILGNKKEDKPEIKDGKGLMKQCRELFIRNARAADEMIERCAVSDADVDIQACKAVLRKAVYGENFPVTKQLLIRRENSAKVDKPLWGYRQN